MANILEYTLSLDDGVSGALEKIGIANDKQLEVWAKVQQQVTEADDTMRQCGVSIGSLRERVAALQSEKEWIPANRIADICQTNTAIQSLESQIALLESAGRASLQVKELEIQTKKLGEAAEEAEIVEELAKDVTALGSAKEGAAAVGELGKQVENTEKQSGGRFKAWLKELKTSIPIMGKITNPMQLMGLTIQKIGSYVQGSQEAWNKQLEAENRLAAAMRKHFGTSEAEIGSIKRLTAAQQAAGVVSDELQLAGAAQLAGFVSNKQNLDTLIPAMNNLMVSQQGLKATEQDAASAGELLGKALQGDTSALREAGLTLTEAQEQTLKYGDEQQRAAALAELVENNVGRMNETLAATPEGKLAKHANAMRSIQERAGSLYTQLQASLLPLFDVLGDALAEVVGWFERNRETILSVMGTIATGIGGVISVVGSTIGLVSDIFGGWIEKLREGNAPIILLTGLLGSLATAIALLTLQSKLSAIWAGIVTTVEWAWTGAQTALNLSMLACPLTWIVAGIVALIAAIAYVCYKVQGWGSLWDGIVGFMKYTFMAWVESVKLYFSTLVNGIMIGLDKIKLGWYKFKDACGLGDSSANKAAIAEINADIEQRQQAITEGAKKVAEYASKAQESLGGIEMSWNSEKSLSDVSKGLKENLGLGTQPGMNTSQTAAETRQPQSPGLGMAGSGTAGSGTASAISSGGNRRAPVTISLRSLVENIVFEGGYESGRDEMQRDLEGALIRVLEMANSAQ